MWELTGTYPSLQQAKPCYKYIKPISFLYPSDELMKFSFADKNIFTDINYASFKIADKLKTSSDKLNPK